MMRKKIALLTLFFASLFFAKGQDYLTDDEIDVIYYVNQARENPAQFAEDYILPFATQMRAAKECYKQMKKMDPLHPFESAEILYLGAKDHVDDTGPEGLVQHEGTDGSQSWDRVERHGEWLGSIGENIQFGYRDPLKIVVDLLIDDGVPGRGHRKNILSKEFNYIGVSIGDHAEYGVMCVQVFAGGVAE